MGCHVERERFDRDGCIKEIVRRILNAQREAVDECVTSCENSIEDLLTQRVRRRRNETTIPFMLICKESCKPFVGAGFISRGRRDRDFECVESPILRVRDFVRGSKSCVNVELLLPVSRRRDGDHHGKEHGEERGHHDHDRDRHHDKDSFCDKFGRRRIDNFRETGVCITLDLDCFCGITCLDPITPEPL
ncbi:CotY/CotZ family spore coat protein [Pseudogracilibacillus sp. SE30717A]|uniref:CotY/CotZ family spore coat protein n=1 Tax=Pseudogracilibacillus sp. SE30717A TaxID=3098293 RepID=UPI00300E2358